MYNREVDGREKRLEGFNDEIELVLLNRKEVGNSKGSRRGDA